MHDGSVHFGFRRLAIVDLTEDGHQPMVSSDGRYLIVFNGEIYNHVELRAELQKMGAQFRGHSDTEVLLEYYRREQTDCLSRLNGMFAFAVYDRINGDITLVRDRLGVKPLFYCVSKNGLAFASEVRALRGLAGIDLRINNSALAQYIRLGFVPEWNCVYDGVQKVPPGTYVRYSTGNHQCADPCAYWTLPPVDEVDGRGEEDWLDEIESLLWDATRIRLRSDVPIGLFLSGGIDSGLIAAAAAAQTSGLTALTIAFPGEIENEAALAASAAAHLCLKNVQRTLNLTEGVGALPSAIGHFDEPFADTSALPTSLVCGEARRHFTVVLSGDGGDEVFGGYPSHVRARKWRAVDGLPLSLRRAVALAAEGVLPRDRLITRATRRFANPVGRFGLGATLYPNEDWVDQCIAAEFNISATDIIESYNANLPNWPDATAIDMSQRTDLRTYLLEDILVKVDRMSMRHSLEVRSPFLDYRVVELGLRIPSRLRTKGGVNKYLLRRLAARHLPSPIINAPKRGFGIPLRSWIFETRAAKDLQQVLRSNVAGFPDPFQNGGADRLWMKGYENVACMPALMRGLCYRWWCGAQ